MITVVRSLEWLDDGACFGPPYDGIDQTITDTFEFHFIPSPLSPEEEAACGFPCCNDGNVCNGFETGVPPDCQPGTPPVCDDNNVCNGSETCDPVGGCQPGTPLNCDDENPCTDDSCDPTTGCQHVNNTRRCDDGNACTTDDRCAGGSCQGGPALQCDDGDVCNGLETCGPAGGCQPGTPLNCDDGNACTDDVCDPQSGCTIHDCIGSFPGGPDLPDADDRTYVTLLDAVVNGPELNFTVDVTRYAGPTGAQILLNASDLVANGLAGPYAELGIVSFGADCQSQTNCNAQHQVRFNLLGVETFLSDPNDPLSPPLNPFPYLVGPECGWSITRFRIPITSVGFPDRGALGTAPAPQPNWIHIDVDGAPACLKIRGAFLRVKLMSPIILIHGNNSDGGFFARQGFTTGLDDAFLLWDNSISMQTNTRSANAAALDTLIPPIVTSFGVDSVHLVAHSKGGLDTREYLERYQPALNDTFEVLSLTTLSTPHNGSVLADIGVTRAAFANGGASIQYSGFPNWTGLLTWLVGTDDGQPDLTTTETATFNATNLPALPSNIVYHAVAADADQNGNAAIDNTPDEYLGLRTESPELSFLHSLSAEGARNTVDSIYQISRNTKSISVTYSNRPCGIGPLGSMTRCTVATLTAVPDTVPLGNDVMVTIPSGLGTGTFAAGTANTVTLIGASGRNHSSVANAGVATTIAPWIIGVESTDGDLK